MWRVQLEIRSPSKYPLFTLQEKPGKTGFPTDNPEERIILKQNIQEKQVSMEKPGRIDYFKRKY